MSQSTLLLPGFDLPVVEVRPAPASESKRLPSSPRIDGLIFREALGIATGDVIATSYGTGPYMVVGIWGPFWWHRAGGTLTVHDRPVMSLGLHMVGGEDGYGINEVWRADDGHWWSGGGSSYVRGLYGSVKTWQDLAGKPSNDEIFVLERATRPAQAGLIEASNNPRSVPYPRIDSVDYGAGDGRIWSCERGCGDFNARRPGERDDSPPPFFGPPSCPRCRGYAQVVIVVEHRAPGEETS